MKTSENNTIFGSEFLSGKQLCQQLGISHSTLNKWEKLSDNPVPFIQIGSGKKWYQLENVKDWILNHD